MEVLRIPFEVLPADLDELAITAPTHFERAAVIARAKGEAIWERVESEMRSKNQPDSQNRLPIYILAADTYLIDPKTEQALEKPQDLAEARQMLSYQSGRTLQEYTGVYWFDSTTGESSSQTVETTVEFRELSIAEIDFYVATEPVLTWSGAFCPAYPTGAALIKRIDGSLTSFTHGFPLDFFIPKLRAAGLID